VPVLSHLQHWFHTCLGLIYPAQCVSCAQRLEADVRRDALEDWLCPPCLRFLPKLEAPFCTTCGEAYKAAQTSPMRCDNCAERKLHFEFARAAYHASGNVREVIHHFKYNKQLYLRRVMGLLTLQAMQDQRLQALLKEDPVLVPVPLHATRHRSRGFNQSEILAEELARHLQLRVCRALERHLPTDPQARLTRAQRLESLTHAFQLSPRYAQQHSNLRGRSIILVDDVFTTGSTADECARLLRKEGNVQKVVVVTAARG
jgi:competence protein ComFC